MWTAENRPRYDRSQLRYPSDLADEEWLMIEPLIPPAKHGGRGRNVVIREVVNGIMYVLTTGCQWRSLPKDLPPRSTVHGYLTDWTYDGTMKQIHRALFEKCREQAERKAEPTAGVSTAKAPKALKKGGLHRSHRV